MTNQAEPAEITFPGPGILGHEIEKRLGADKTNLALFVGKCGGRGDEEGFSDFCFLFSFYLALSTLFGSGDEGEMKKGSSQSCFGFIPKSRLPAYPAAGSNLNEKHIITTCT